CVTNKARVLQFRRTGPYTVAGSLRSSSARGRGDGEQRRGASMYVNQSVLSLPWYRTLSRAQWKVLIASNLGWTFDGFEIFALFLTVGFALRQLLDAAECAAIPQYAGYILACTVFGWATGGVIGGIIADSTGRNGTMMLAILAY